MQDKEGDVKEKKKRKGKRRDGRGFQTEIAIGHLPGSVPRSYCVTISSLFLAALGWKQVRGCWIIEQIIHTSPRSHKCLLSFVTCPSILHNMPNATTAFKHGEMNAMVSI